MNQKCYDYSKMVFRFALIVFISVLISLVFVKAQPANAAAGDSFNTAIQISSDITNGEIVDGKAKYYKQSRGSGQANLSVTSVVGSKTITLYDNNKNVIATASAGNGNSGNIKIQYLLNGVYYIKVSGATGGFHIVCYSSSAGETFVEKQNNKYDSFDDAKDITSYLTGTNNIITGQLGYSDSSDSYYFNAVHNGTLKVSTFSLFGVDHVASLNLKMYNASKVSEGTLSLSGTKTISKGKHYIIVSGGNAAYHLRLLYSIPDSAHNYGNWVIGRNSTCIVNGYKEKKCKDCGKTVKQNLPLANHDFSNGYTVIKEPTCTEKGSMRGLCSVCGDQVTATIPTLSHSWKYFKIAPKLLKNGIEYHKCTVCGAIKDEVVLKGYAKSYVKSLKVVRGKKAFTVKWRKQSKANQKRFNGYQIRYSAKSNMSKAKKLAVKKNANAKTIKKLKKNKKYYVQVRTFTKKSGTKFYSKWSAKKAIRTK